MNRNKKVNCHAFLKWLITKKDSLHLIWVIRNHLNFHIIKLTTSSWWSIEAPLLTKCLTTSMWPSAAALCNAVWPVWNWYCKIVIYIFVHSNGCCSLSTFNLFLAFWDVIVTSIFHSMSFEASGKLLIRGNQMAFKWKCFKPHKQNIVILSVSIIYVS